MVQKGKRWDGQQWVEGSPANEEGEAKARRKPRREEASGAAERDPRPGSPEQHDGRRKTSQFRGVAFNNGKWYATITVNSKRKHIGAFGSEDEAVAIANNTRYGLAGSVWTSDLDKGRRVSEAIDTGMVWVNTWLHRDLRVPFGGVKDSGVGREGGKWSLGFFSEAMNVCVKHD